MTVLKLLTAATAMSSVLVVLAGRDAPPKPIPLVERWPAEEFAAPKADRLPIAVQPVVVMLPPEPKQDTMALATPADIAQNVAEKRPKPERDICQKHGMHKQITKGGKSWRCKR
jgi:hypothetical protein